MIIRMIDLESGEEEIIEVESQIPNPSNKIFQVYTDKQEELKKILRVVKKKDELQ